MKTLEAIEIVKHVGYNVSFVKGYYVLTFDVLTYNFTRKDLVTLAKDLKHFLEVEG